MAPHLRPAHGPHGALCPLHERHPHERAARAVQAERFAGLGKSNMMVNGDMGLAEVQPAKRLDAQGKELLRAAV